MLKYEHIIYYIIDMPKKTPLVKKLRTVRKEHGLSMKDLCRKAKISYNTIISLEIRNVKEPKLSTVIKLAKFYKMSLSQLLKGTEFES